MVAVSTHVVAGDGGSPWNRLNSASRLPASSNEAVISHQTCGGWFVQNAAQRTASLPLW